LKEKLIWKKLIWIGVPIVLLVTARTMQVTREDNLVQQKNDAAQAILRANPPLPAQSADQSAEQRAHGAEERAQYAKFVDRKFIEAGIESYTKASGDDNTILEITDVLAGRVRAHQIVGVMDYSRMRSLGFKSVAYTNGEMDDLSFSENWAVPQ
jgi:hypothetical protein